MGFFNNFTVKSRISALFAFSIILFALFGGFSLQRIGMLAGLTKSLYDHPLKVSNAALRAETGMIRMHRTMKDLVMSRNSMDTNTAIQELLDDERDVYRELAQVKELILGDEGKKLAQVTIDLFAGWKPLRAAVEELVLKGDTAGAISLHRKNSTDYVSRLERQTRELNAYARKKADGFMQNALEVQRETRNQIVLAICLVAMVCFGAAFFLVESITRSLGYLKDKMAASTSSGEISMVEIEGQHEIADLATNFNALVTVVRDQLWLRNNLNDLNRELSSNLSSGELSDRGIRFVSRALKACAGAVYLVDRNDGSSDLKASFAVVEGKLFAKRFLQGEGVVGQVARENKPILLETVTRDDACTVSGTFSEPPGSIYCVPIAFEQDVLGVMEVASFDALDELKKQFMDQAAQIIASQLNISLQNAQIQDLYRKSQVANEALVLKTDEINASNNELSALNKELQAQSNELQAQRDELQAQAVELEKKRFQVEEADRLKSEFLSNMSHELRTPLNSIMSLSQLMISRGVGKDPEKATEYLRVIDRNGRQLLNLINDILDLTKIESGRMDIFPNKFDVRKIVERVMETARPLSDKKGLQLQMQTDGAMVLFSDEDKIYQILLNFLSNAIKFTERGMVSLQVRAAGPEVFFIVRDTGIGISAENLDSIFDEFRQVDGSFTREYEGTGLGLAISKKLAALLGGNISVESTPGEGSTFTLALPICCSEELTVSAATPESAPVTFSTGLPDAKTVLVIDDEEAARDLLVEVLFEAGYAALAAVSGREGLEFARRILPDVICLDVLMPSMDGWEVLRQLKADAATAAIPVVITSVSRDKDTGWALGAAGFVSKPLDSAAMRAEIGRVTTKQKVRSVLVVDDNEIASLQICTALQEEGFDVVAARDGAEGLERVRQQIPDGIVLDLMMPKIDGFQVLEQIRSRPETATLPVLILTAKEITAAERSRLTNNNVQQLIQKGSTDRGQLVASVKRMLNPCRSDVRKQAAVLAKVKSGHSTPSGILLVEDNADNRLTVTAIMEGIGCDVFIAEDGAQGVRAAREHQPGLILMDIQLPVMDGITAIKTIKADSSTAHIPIVAVSARAMKGEKETIMLAGADDYVSKPINPQELLDKVQKWKI